MTGGLQQQKRTHHPGAKEASLASGEAADHTQDSAPDVPHSALAYTCLHYTDIQAGLETHWTGTD